jgi:hypothetical protein
MPLWPPTAKNMQSGNRALVGNAPADYASFADGVTTKVLPLSMAAA